MKRRQRRPVLELNKGQDKCKQPGKDYHGQNAPANPLANLLCHYNSDSDTEESKKDINNKLDDQVNNFLKEIQLIAPKEACPSEPNNSAANASRSGPTAHLPNHPATLWQECLDEATGYPYYWHIETNEVTWEMPSELRALKNTANVNPVVKPATGQESSHWVDFSSIAYQQSHENIPEGMIPREVVARNRNRYMASDSAHKQKPAVEQEAANTSDAMDDDSDDGRIEMITSYGSEETDSETENEAKNEPAAVTKTEPAKSAGKTKSTEFVQPSPVILPQLPSSSQAQEQEVSETRVERDSKLSEGKEAKYSKAVSKSQRAKDNRSTKEPVEESTTKREPEVDFRISLVPGYDEDSEGEEEEEKKVERKCLFPIPQDEAATESAPLRHKSITCLNRPTLHEDGRTVDSENDPVSLDRRTDSEREGSTENEPAETSKPDDEKANIFLDTSHGRNKCFQRKKRIAFEVPSTKAKAAEETDTIKTEIDAQQQDGNSCDAEQETEQSQKDSPTQQQQQQKEYTDFTEDTTESVKSFSKEASNQGEEESAGEEQSKEEQEEVNGLSQIISEKLKFLSEGKPSVSPVQTMAIQLQTLYVAWEGGCLEKSYLRRWLTDTGHELERLEQDAAPPGWLCQWDRSHKRYYYENASNGVTQWTYPDTGIAGGTEEMEICSTPPPAEQDETIASEADGTKKENDGSSSQKKTEGVETAEVTEGRPSDIEAPPPPQISNPSPPPPPRIFAEDLLKKDKRRRDNNAPEKLDNKKKRLDEAGPVAEVKLENSLAAQTPLSPQTTSAVLPNVGNTEPLPPGVDLPEAPYELPATALKRILYNTVQQGGTIYDPTSREVPILGHPAAIVQEHYLQYPAYHQHIHAQAALVLPHKHTVQPTIQLIPEYTPIYTNHKVIEKPPVKTQKESLVSALDSFYSDIARIEKSAPEQTQVKDSVVETPPAVQEETKVETEQEQPVDNATKEKKKKKARVGISKKHKEVSSMVAKWQRALQNFEDNT